MRYLDGRPCPSSGGRLTLLLAAGCVDLPQAERPAAGHLCAHLILQQALGAQNLLAGQLGRRFGAVRGGGGGLLAKCQQLVLQPGALHPWPGGGLQGGGAGSMGGVGARLQHCRAAAAATAAPPPPPPPQAGRS